jgi:cysteine-rich repeat protein
MSSHLSGPTQRAMLPGQDPMHRRLMTFSLLLLLPSACRVFDPNLWMGAEDSGSKDGPISTMDGPNGVTLAERCEGTIPVVVAGGAPYDIDTRPMTSDYRELSACVGHELPGNDGFVAVDMKAGEKWHVHINPVTPDYDPAVYILASCDERACAVSTAIDECGPGKSEHLSFVAPSTARYLVGIDSPTAGGGQATVVIARPQCGNNMVEHSETCDDGNTTSGDGCDSLCRKELPATTNEMEPNDDLRAANIITMRTAAARVTAQIATRCDHDMYSVSVPAGGSIRAKVAAIGATCVSDGTAARLSLIASDGLTEMGAGTAPTGDDCPAIDDRHAFAKNLAAGEYFLMVKRPSNTALNYQLTVEGP